MPNYWVPLYNSVSFSRMPYKKCIENRKWQDKVLKTTGYVALCGSLIGITILITKFDLINMKLLKL